MSSTVKGALEPTTITVEQAVQVSMACPLEIPIMWWGPTGVGKTQAIYQMAERMNLDAMTVIAQITSPIDWTGVPHLETIGEKKYTKFSQPLHLPHPGVDGQREQGIFFFDELPNATKSVQAAIQSLLTRGEYNGYLWPSGWKQIAAGNRRTDRANTYEMPVPVRARLMHLYLGYDMEVWQQWGAGSQEAVVSMDQSFPTVTEIMQPDEPRIHPIVRAFIRSNPNALHNISDGFDAIACPRTWEYVSHIMKLNLPDELTMIMYSGLVGPAAAEFFVYLKDTALLPDPHDLLTGKAKLRKSGSKTILETGKREMELEASQLYALATSLGSAVTEKTLDGLLKCIEQFGMSEYGIIAVEDMLRRLPEMDKSSAFISWAINHGEMLVRK